MTAQILSPSHNEIRFCPQGCIVRLAELRLTECFLVSAAALASLAEGGGLTSLCSLDLSHMSAMQSLRVTHLEPLRPPHRRARLLRDCLDPAALLGAAFIKFFAATAHVACMRGLVCTADPVTGRCVNMTLLVNLH